MPEWNVSMSIQEQLWPKNVRKWLGCHIRNLENRSMSVTMSVFLYVAAYCWGGCRASQFKGEVEVTFACLPFARRSDPPCGRLRACFVNRDLGPMCLGGIFEGRAQRSAYPHRACSRGQATNYHTLNMSTTRPKRRSGRDSQGKNGMDLPKKGSHKKSRRILVPSSVEIARESRKEKIESMNWGNIEREGNSVRSKTKPASAAAEAKEKSRGNGLAWKDSSLPKKGDQLQCRHFLVCPGCDFDRDFEKTPVMADSRSFLDNLRAAEARAQGRPNAALDMEPHTIHGCEPNGWRTLAKLAVKPVSKWGGVELGLYKLGSHDVTAIPECRVHHPSVNRAVTLLQETSRKFSVTAYRSDTMGGDLRYVQIAVERKTGRVQLALVWNKGSFRDATPLLQHVVRDLRSRDPGLFHSIWANFRTGAGNAIFSRDPYSWHRFSGPEFMKELIGPQKIPFYFSPPHFRQANLDHFESIVEAVVDWVPEGSAVCELYAGVGVLGINCASKASLVRCSDLNAFNPRSFERARRHLPPEVQRQVSFEVLSAEDAINEGEADGCDVLIVDPPRKGLDAGVLDALRDPDDVNSSSLRRIVYVSCGFDALKRDALTLLDGGWSLRHSEGYVLFPGTDHVETLAIFDR